MKMHIDPDQLSLHSLCYVGTSRRVWLANFCTRLWRIRDKCIQYEAYRCLQTRVEFHRLWSTLPTYTFPSGTTGIGLFGTIFSPPFVYWHYIHRFESIVAVALYQKSYIHQIKILY